MSVHLTTAKDYPNGDVYVHTHHKLTASGLGMVQLSPEITGVTLRDDGADATMVGFVSAMVACPDLRRVRFEGVNFGQPVWQGLWKHLAGNKAVFNRIVELTFQECTQVPSMLQQAIPSGLTTLSIAHYRDMLSPDELLTWVYINNASVQVMEFTSQTKVVSDTLAKQLVDANLTVRLYTPRATSNRFFTPHGIH